MATNEDEDSGMVYNCHKGNGRSEVERVGGRVRGEEEEKSARRKGCLLVAYLVPGGMDVYCTVAVHGHHVMPQRSVCAGLVGTVRPLGGRTASR